METRNATKKEKTPFYSRWWGNITNYLEGWKNYFWDMFNPSEETQSNDAERRLRRSHETTTRVVETATALSGFARQFRIEREGNYGAREFMKIVEPDVFADYATK